MPFVWTEKGYNAAAPVQKNKDYLSYRFKGAKRDCLSCKLRQVVFFMGQNSRGKERFTEKMKRKIDTAMGLERFSLCGKKKVNMQWNLFYMVHNLKKVHACGAVDV